jgi:hypothetical protein
MQHVLQVASVETSWLIAKEIPRPSPTIDVAYVVYSFC